MLSSLHKNPQLNTNGELTHLLSIHGLPVEILTQILDTASSFLKVSDRDVKKVPLLRGKSVFNVFFENSTRTRTTFEIAAKRLSADVINLDVTRSSTAKGETLLDTVDNLVAMHADMFVVRHAASGAPYLIVDHLRRVGRTDVHVVNAGDGRHGSGAAHRRRSGRLPHAPDLPDGDHRPADHGRAQHHAHDFFQTGR